MKKLAYMITVVLIAAGVSADLMVNYTGVTASGTMRVADTHTDNGDTWNFSESVALGTGNSTSSTIYGGMNTVWNDTNAGYNPILEMTPTYQFRILVSPSVKSSGTSLKGMLVWRKDDFLAGGNEKTVAFTSGNTVSAGIDLVSATAADFRITVKQGTDWYVSETKITANGTLTVDPTATTWRTISTDGNYTIGDTASSITFDDVQAVGLYASAVRSTDASRFVLRSFEMNAIPEPATIGMLGLGALVALLARRQCRK